ncbi:hypothetical protein EX30DRAFT_366921 [Ascodesmis nigricans]|uniref:Uncharacterized protein n=1 Tax=Ascodesmis nigricans TaxID=341454 RepID=A0A4S2MJF4_9PEZI|nr:hypothetical protein EX30DRAFT_366921 [Ascodesmis nigricans]
MHTLSLSPFLPLLLLLPRTHARKPTLLPDRYFHLQIPPSYPHAPMRGYTLASTTPWADDSRRIVYPFQQGGKYLWLSWDLDDWESGTEGRVLVDPEQRNMLWLEPTHHPTLPAYVVRAGPRNNLRDTPFTKNWGNHLGDLSFTMNGTRGTMFSLCMYEETYHAENSTLVAPGRELFFGMPKKEDPRCGPPTTIRVYYSTVPVGYKLMRAEDGYWEYKPPAENETASAAVDAGGAAPAVDSAYSSALSVSVAPSSATSASSSSAASSIIPAASAYSSMEPKLETLSTPATTISWEPITKSASTPSKYSSPNSVGTTLTITDPTTPYPCSRTARSSCIPSPVPVTGCKDTDKVSCDSTVPGPYQHEYQDQNQDQDKQKGDHSRVFRVLNMGMKNDRERVGLLWWMGRKARGKVRVSEEVELAEVGGKANLEDKVEGVLVKAVEEQEVPEGSEDKDGDAENGDMEYEDGQEEEEETGK